LTDPGQQGHGLFGPIIVDEAKAADVDLDTAAVLSDWKVESSGQIKDDFANPAIGRGSGRKAWIVLTNDAPAPLKLSARPSARVRLRLGNATTGRLTTVAITGAKPFILAVDGQPSEPFEPLNSQFPMGPGAQFELMFDMPVANVRLDLRGDAGEEDHPLIAIASEGDPSPPPRAASAPLQSVAAG
jgi:FtsP/CotA-like multicopper oxidase with cupredoxin domain